MTPRDLVTRRIVSRAKSYPTFDLTPFDVSGLDARDAALARAIDHAVARHWLTLMTVVDRHLDQEWANLQPTVQAALLVGSAQLLYMERLPDHAVIHEAVDWTKHNARRKAGGLVNAVLRRVAALRGETRGPVDVDVELTCSELPRDGGRVIQLTADIFDEDPGLRLGQQTSHPAELIRHWIHVHGWLTARKLAMHSLVHPPVIVTGVSGDATDDLLAHETPGFFVYTGPRESLEGLLGTSESARVQDPGTASAMMLSTRVKPILILDLCAGRGTKTRQLLELHPNAQIVATDLDDVRCGVLRKSFASHERVRVAAFNELAQYREQADLLVLDVPCSNTGVLARRVEAKYRFNVDSLVAVRDLQRQIIADAIPLLSPNGHLLYATCSIEQVENQKQTEWIAQWHPLETIDSTLILPRGVGDDSPTMYRDGGYAALLRRS